MTVFNWRLRQLKKESFDFMLWDELQVILSVLLMLGGIALISLILNEKSKLLYFRFLFFVQLAANLLSGSVFFCHYLHSVMDFFKVSNPITLWVTLFSENKTINAALLTLSFVLSIITGYGYLKIRTHKKRVIADLFYSNTTPIAIVNNNEIFDSNSAFLEFMNDFDLESLRKEDKIEKDGVTYLVKKYPIHPYFKTYGITAVVLLDVTTQEYTLHQLELLDQRLSMVSMLLKNKIGLLEELIELKSNNDIAMQLHDEIGHNLTLGISLIERLQDPHAEPKIPLPKVLTLLREGLRFSQSLQLERIMDHPAKMLEDMLESYIIYLNWIGIKVTLNLNIKRFMLDRNYMFTLYQICKEAFSNTVKYSSATAMTIVLDIETVEKETFLKLVLQDNGVGCPIVKEGNGLKAIRVRTISLKGKFTYDSSNGFMIECLIPFELKAGEAYESV